MAKPMSSQPIIAGCSYPVPPRSTQGSSRHHCRRRRQHPAAHPSPHFVAPSSGLLSLLATIAASSVSADGSPIPPSFLCPFFDYGTSVITSNIPRDNLPPGAIHLPPKRREDPPNVPDKYQPGPDGRWRRVEAYTLYGSTVCPDCKGPESSLPSAKNEAKPSSSYPVDASTATPSVIDILDTLPTGWKPSRRTHENRTTLILALSLVLAFVICFFIIGCLLWRKNTRRKFRENDVEMKARRRRAPDSEEEAAEKQIRAKQKIWARATARWKANARYSARQRRGKRILSLSRGTHAQTSSVSLQQPHDGLSSAATSPSPSRPLSRRSSTESIHSEPSLDPVIISSATDEVETSAPGLSASPFLPDTTLTSPPAYRHRPRTSVASISETLPPVNQELPHPSITPPAPSTKNFFNSQAPTDDGILCTPVVHTGHVATDDKSLLARLTELASAPPLGDSPTESSNIEVSAPVWHDEELDDFVETSHNGSCDPNACSIITSDSLGSSPALPFPPPPSKGKMAMPAFYDYSFEDLTMSESEPEPSAPPFEESSVPSLSDVDVLPSAPPLTESVSHVECRVHVPEWEDCQPVREELGEGHGEEMGEETAQNHDREEANIGRHPTPNPQPQMAGSSSDTTTQPVQGPVANDGIPPRYSP